MERAIVVRLLCALLFGVGILVLTAGCDTDISGDALENQPPDTQLSVRDASLVDNLEGANRFTSTVFVAWSGTDLDGFVSFFELRFHDENEAPPATWQRTTRNDTLVLLPIPQGERIANVVFEVRAFDNEGLADPDPARTVFPIQNSPPTIKLNQFDLPPDTTFSIFSFAWAADDPDGLDNLASVEVSLNDSLNFTALPADVEFVTFVGDVDRDDPGQTLTETRVYTGRSFQRSNIFVPGLQLDAENTFYLRSVDQTDTTSVRRDFTWYVKKPRGRILFVNDYRKAAGTRIQQFHLDLLRAYLPDDVGIDTWDISQPFVTGNVGNAPRSAALPPSAEPTLQQTLTLYDFIYWIATATTNSVQGNNLPFAANVMDLFFGQGGKLIIHTPVSLPDDPNANLGNPAIAVLPLTDLIAFPDSLRRLSLVINAPLQPAEALPGLGLTLPPLKSQAFIIGPLPYVAASANVLPLYNAEYTYRTRTNNEGPWPGPSTVASISADGRVGLFALPLINEQTGAPVLSGQDDDPATAIRAIHLMLESLGFPKR